MVVGNFRREFLDDCNVSLFESYLYIMYAHCRYFYFVIV